MDGKHPPTPAVVELDLREDLRAGREPLPRILEAVSSLDAGQELLLRTTFEPLPLYRLLESKGFSHQARRLGRGDWEIRFRPGHGKVAKSPRASPTNGSRNETPVEDPRPSLRLDNRGLGPPEPMMRILAALEGMQAGETLLAIQDREPMFLYPELSARGYEVRVEKKQDGVYLWIQRGG